MLDRDLRSRITGGATREALQDAIEATGKYQNMQHGLQRLVLGGTTPVEEARKTMTALE